MPNSSAIDATFAELNRQQELISACTALYKDLSNHFSSLDKKIDQKFDSIRSNRHSLDLQTQNKLASLNHREQTIQKSVDLAISHIKKLSSSSPFPSNSSDLPSRLRSLCSSMDSTSFFDLIVSSRKETDLLRHEIPLALKQSLDPAKFVMDAISVVFPFDRRAVKSPSGDLGWVCVLLLEGLVAALADPVMGAERLMVSRIVRERAGEMAGGWRAEMEARGGVESARAQDVHAFLQHLVTFGIGVREEREFYRKLVVSVSWRKQMPKIAIALGLEDMMKGL